MEIDYDPAKNERNIAERGLSFERAAELDWETGLYRIDSRRDYGEQRRTVLALLDGRLHLIVYLLRERGIRVISFRKANKREQHIYEQAREG